MSTEVIRAKRGDTLVLRCGRTDSAGNPVDLTGQSIACELVPVAGGGTVPLAATVTNAAGGEFTLSAEVAATADLLGPFYGDVEFDVGGTVVSSETFIVSFERDYTNAD